MPLRTDLGHLVPPDDMEPTVATLAQVYVREYPQMVRIACFVGGSRDWAEEVVQDAFIKLQERFDELDNPVGYLRSCVVNGCRDRLRRRQRFDKRVPVLALDVVRDVAADGADGTRLDLVRALQALPFRSRVVLVLRFYGGWTVPEIADALNVPVGTVKTSIHRGLARLRKEIDS